MTESRVLHVPCLRVAGHTDDGAKFDGHVLVLFPGTEQEVAVRVDEQGYLRLTARTKLSGVRVTDNSLRVVQERLAKPPPAVVTYDTK